MKKVRVLTAEEAALLVGLKLVPDGKMVLKAHLVPSSWCPQYKGQGRLLSTARGGMPEGPR